MINKRRIKRYPQFTSQIFNSLPIVSNNSKSIIDILNFIDSYRNMTLNTFEANIINKIHIFKCDDGWNKLELKYSLILIKNFIYFGIRYI